MRSTERSFSKLLLFSLCVLGIALSGVGTALHPSSAGAPQPAGSPLAGQAALASPSASPTLPVTFTPSATSTRVPILVGALPTGTPSASLYAFVEAPQGTVPSAYIMLHGFQTGLFSSKIELVGTLNTADFRCPGSPCMLPLDTGQSRIVFQATLANGQTSDTVLALVWVDQLPDGFHVRLDSVSQYFARFTDACLGIWDIEDDTGPAWAQFAQYPYELNTQVTLHNLVTRLIVNGYVDTRDCPAGGLSQDLTWPNGCGVERARDKMIAWQNQYDDAIWLASDQVGIPPRILKTLIQVESQFWPGNERFYLDEFGLGQVNELGVDVLLRKDHSLYQDACSQVLSNCFTPYISLSPAERAMVRGALLNSQNSVCPTCEGGIDLSKSKQSITFVARMLRSNCEQVRDSLNAHSAQADYETRWKLTLLSYHSGINCLEQTIATARKNHQSLDWDALTEKSYCPDGIDYVDGFWGDLLSFDYYRYSSGASPVGIVVPVMVTRTPIPSPTPILSQAHVLVAVYMDANGNDKPDPEEGLDGIPVQLTFPDGRTISMNTIQGLAEFDLTGERMGLQVVASLPGLYRSYRFFIPQQGAVPIIFMFDQPQLPGGPR